MSSNIALTDSQYLKSDAPNIEGKSGSLFFNIKTGTGIQKLYV
jgi:Fe(3+) dicitrate transport protein